MVDSVLTMICTCHNRTIIGLQVHTIPVPAAVDAADETFDGFAVDPALATLGSTDVDAAVAASGSGHASESAPGHYQLDVGGDSVSSLSNGLEL